MGIVVDASSFQTKGSALLYLVADRIKAQTVCVFVFVFCRVRKQKALSCHQGHTPLPLYLMPDPHRWDSHTQLGLLPDHWLFFWHVMTLSPTSSKAAWHSKVSVSPCRKLLPVRFP